jgi:hypothetical protein
MARLAAKRVAQRRAAQPSLPQRLSRHLQTPEPEPTAPGRRVACGPLTRDEFADLMTVIRGQHPCPPKQQGRSNRERSHQRRVTTLSYWIRHVPNIRSIDIDQVAYCPGCLDPLVWMETKPDNNPDEWAYIRELARRHHCYAILGVESEGRIQEFSQVMLYIPDGMPDPRAGGKKTC